MMTSTQNDLITSRWWLARGAGVRLAEERVARDYGIGHDGADTLAALWGSGVSVKWSEYLAGARRVVHERIAMVAALTGNYSGPPPQGVDAAAMAPLAAADLAVWDPEAELGVAMSGAVLRAVGSLGVADWVVGLPIGDEIGAG